MSTGGTIHRRDEITPWGQDIGAGALQAHMSLSDSSLEFVDTVGGADAAPQTITAATSVGSLAGVQIGTIAYGAGWSSGLTVTVVPLQFSVITVIPSTGALAPGVYTATVPITDTAADNSPQNLAVTLTVQAAVQPPLILIAPSSLTFTGTAGGGVSASQTLTVTNGGGGAFTALTLGAPSYVTGAGWLTATLNGNTITATTSALALAAGSYTATLAITDAAASNSPVSLLVALDVAAVPVPILALSKTSLAFVATAGAGITATQSILVSNAQTGSTMQGVAVGTISDAWLLPVLTSSTLVTTAVSPAALTAGTYTGSFTVTSTNAGNSPVTVPVTVAVSPAPVPVMSLSRSSLTFSGTAGGGVTNTETVTVSNIGGGTMTGLALGQPSAAWLHASLSGSVISVYADPSAQSAGSLAGTISVSSNASNSPVTLAVTFAVSSAPVPVIKATPTTLFFTGTASGSATAAQNVVITNAGGGSFTNLAASAGSAAWLLPVLTGTTVAVTADPAVQTAGIKSGTFTITADNAVTVTITVQFQVAAQAIPILGVSPATLAFNGIAGGAATAVQTQTVSNIGTGTLTGPAVGNASAAWLLPSINTAGTLVSVYANPAAQTAGTKTGTYDITDASATTVTVPVSFVVGTAPARITLSTLPGTFTALVGGSNPASQVIQITNSGGGTLAACAVGSKTYTPAGTWLTATVGGSGNNQTLTLACTTGALTAGTYTVTFPLTSAAATNSPVTISVLFVVTAVTQPGNHRAPRFPLMRGSVSNATFNAVDDTITWNPFTNNGLTDPDGDATSAGYYYGGTTRTANSQATLITALANSLDTDIVSITGNFTISSQLILPARSAGWVLITSANPCGAVVGNRVQPSDFTASHPYKITLSTGTTTSIVHASGSDGWHFRDIWFENASTGEVPALYWWAYPDAGGNGHTTTAAAPERLKIDRCYWNNPFNNSDKYAARIAYLSGRYGRVIQSYFSGGCRNGSSDSQAILIGNSLGDIQIEDNYLEGASENILIGGVNTRMGVQNYAHNIHIRGNYMPKRSAWLTNVAGASGGSTAYAQIKNFFEIKQGRYIVYEDNYLENHNGAAQQKDIVLRISPLSTTEQAYPLRTTDVLIKNNYGTNGMGTVMVADTSDVLNGVVPIGNIEIVNNALVSPRFTTADGNLRTEIGAGATSTSRPNNIVLDHNWLGDKNSMITFTPVAAPNIIGLVVTNNVYWQDMAYQAVLGQKVAPNKTALDSYCGTNPATGAPVWTFAKNVAIKSTGADNLYGTGTASLQPAPYSNITYTTQALFDAQFETLATARKVKATSTLLYRTATDSTAATPRDIGPDWDMLQRAIAART